MAHFKIYNASAGAGKTYNLVKNYLKICLGSDNSLKFRQILAITFTNKAANEMKVRIIEKLQTFSEFNKSGNEDPMLDNIAEELEESKTRLSFRAEEVLRAILHNYSAFSVSTIDKFTNRLIRSFAHDLKLPANYEVELDSNEMLGEAIDRMLADLSEDSRTAKVLLQFVQKNLDEGKSPRPERKLLNMGRNLFEEGAVLFLKSMQDFDTDKFIKVRDGLYSEIKILKEDFKEQAEQLLNLIHSQGLQKNHFSRGTVYSYILSFYEGNIPKWPPGNTILGVLEEGKSFYAKKDAAECAHLFSLIENELREGLSALVRRVYEKFPRIHLIDLILRDIYSLAALAEIESYLQAVKEETNRLPIGEFNKLISGKLDKEPSAYLFEKLGDRYQHFFIDEFQDTSVLQWKNLLPLINNAMASSGSAMIVGDGKQSIYRWRGGDVEQFIGLSRNTDVSNKVLLAEQLIELYPRETVNLGSNYRSRKNVVEFNNDFFTTSADLLLGENFKDIYLQSSQACEREEGGYVVLKQLKYENREAYERAQAEECHKVIIDSMQRGYRHSDITILVRKKEQGTFLAEFLINEGISVISQDSLAIQQSEGIKAMISFLRFFARPDDFAGRWDLLNYIWKYFDLNDSFKQSYHFLHSMLKAPFSEVNTFLKKNLGSYDPGEFLMLSLVDKVYLLAKMLNLNSHADPFIHTFFDQIVDFHSNKGGGLAAFIRWWDDKGCDKNISLTQGMDAIQIMTVHKSKGLEFPVTIVAFADWLATREPHGSSAWIDLRHMDMHGLPAARVGLNSGSTLVFPEYQELYDNNKSNIYLDNLNMAYVAFTRAVDELYVFGSKGKTNDTQNLTRYISNFLSITGEIEESMVFGEPLHLAESIHEQAEEVLKSYAFADWKQKLEITINAPLNWREGESRETSYGKKIHDLLAAVESGNHAVEVLQAKLTAGEYLESEKQVLTQLLKSVIEHPGVAQYFREDILILNENEVLLPGSGTLRPDRIVIENEQVHIIDYKTGVPHQNHQKQVEKYREQLSKMGYENGDNVLVYINEDIVVEKW